MGLFFEVLSAINNPNQQANVDQLSSFVNSIQQLSQKTGVQPAVLQSAISAIGSSLRPALQRQASGGQLDRLLGQLGNLGTSGGLGSLQSMLTPQIQQQLVQAVTQKSGLSASVVQSLLPALLPIVLNFFKLGATKPGKPGGNPLLGAFLKSGDSNDLGDVIRLADRFLHPVR